MIKVRLNNLRFYGYHGAFSEEKKLGQNFLVNIEVSFNYIKACKTDDLNDTLDYTKIYDIAKEIMENKKGANLLEYVAANIAESIYNYAKENKNIGIDFVKVILKKERVPYNGIESSEVEIIWPH